MPETTLLARIKFMVEGLPALTAGKKAVQDLSTQLGALQGFAKQLRLDTYTMGRTIEEAGLGISATGRLFDRSTGQFVAQSRLAETLAGRFDSLTGVFSLQQPVYSALIEQGGRFTSVGGKLGHVTRQLTLGMRGFRMEMLSVMFFGMAMQGMFMSWIDPALKAFGVFDMFQAMLLVIFIPVMEMLVPILFGIMEWFMNLPDGVKKAIGILVIIGLVAASLLVGFMVLGLGIGGLIRSFDMLKIAGTILKGGLKGAFAAIGKAWTGMISFISAHPIILVILAIIAIILILNEMWKRNIWGIRQKWGGFLIWFAGVFDRWLKPLLLAIGAGVIVMVNSIIFHVENLKRFWTLAWLAIKLVAFTIWNAILTGIKWVVDGIIGFINILIRARNAIAGFLGLGEQWAELKPLDISAFTADTNAIVEQMRTVAGEIATSAQNRGKVINEQIMGWKKMLDGVAPSLKKMGEESIETGNKIDKGLVKGTGFLEDAFGAVKEQIGGFMGGLMGAGEQAEETSDAVAGQLTPAVDKNTQSLVDNLTGLRDQANALNNEASPAIQETTSNLINQTKELKNTTSAVTDYASESTSNISDMSDEVKVATEIWNKHTNTSVEGLASVNKAMNVVTSSTEAYIRVLKRIPKEIVTHIRRYETTYIRRVSLGGLFGWIGLQEGGIVTKPIIAMLGERGKKEAVIPLERGFKPTEIYFSPTINITATVGAEMDIRALGDKLSSMWREDLRRMVGGLRA